MTFLAGWRGQAATDNPVLLGWAVDSVLPLVPVRQLSLGAWYMVYPGSAQVPIAQGGEEKFAKHVRSRGTQRWRRIEPFPLPTELESQLQPHLSLIEAPWISWVKKSENKAA